jgi:hypothetical protein
VALKQGDKALVGNKGFRKYLRSEGKHFEIDEAMRQPTAANCPPTFRN